MVIPQVRVAEPSEGARIMQTLTIGFANDPVARYLWPNLNTYLAIMPKSIMAYSGKALTISTAYTIGDDYDHNYGAALWLPPAIEPDKEEYKPIIESLSAKKQAELTEIFEHLKDCSPKEPHWYLAIMAVDPYYQGQGLGSVLLQHTLRQCDQGGKASYLESSNPRNISLYKRHGFEVIAEVKVGNFPVLIPMVRQPGS